ncbi:MAG: peptide chain release factor 2, partial [Candidatus Cloacimonetes bacterium]|nr:peptide chain release factor 2 [Candidatus Cloacimonadota bacterium]
DKIENLASIADDLNTYLIMLDEEFSEELLHDAADALNSYRTEVEKAESECLLNEQFDHCNAILNIHPGAGGTESQDWAFMLFRMYSRWCEQNGFSYNIIDYLAGEEAGIKNVTLEINGEQAYGYLKAEIGIHRLVRISPFNAQGKRQTSFASVFVYPEIDDDIEIDIDPKDLKIDTYRSSGSGGQHVNTTDSAVRITHLPTNIVVSCQNERSQNKNREKAMSILKSRLYQHFEEIRQKERDAQESTKSEIGWGNQIRSYVFQPYQMVKDHRTNHEIGNTERVMDGDLNPFIIAFLKASAEKKQ